MASLYGLSKDIAVLDEMYFDLDTVRMTIIDMETGEFTDEEKAEMLQKEAELLASIEEYTIDLIKNKTESIAKHLLQNEADVLMFKNEEKRLAKDRKQIETKIENTKKYVKLCMENMKVKEIKTPIGAFKMTTSKVVEVTNEELLPEEAFKVKKEVSKTVIKNMIKQIESENIGKPEEGKVVFQGAGIVDSKKVNFK